MNQDQNDELQQAINAVSQSELNNASTPNISQHDAGMTQDPNAQNGNASDVAAAMASVLPDSAQTPPTTAPESAQTDTTTPSQSNVGDVNISLIKEQALKELSPLLDKTKLEPEEKFRVYRDMIETLHDNSLLMPALEATKQIQDESARAEALLYLVQMIDDLGIK